MQTQKKLMFPNLALENPKSLSLLHP